MKRQTLFLLSVGANLLLAGLVLHLAQTRRAVGRPPGVSQTITRRIVRVLNAPHPPNPGVVAVNAPFHWSLLESTDYRTYIENLRTIGCPELTIYDIVSADVNALYDGRVKELVAGVTGRFWEFIVKPHDMQQMVETKQTELEALAKERDDGLAALFGEENPADQRADQDRTAEKSAREKQSLDFLPEEKSAKIIEIQDRCQAARAALDPSNTNLSPGLRQQKIEALAGQKMQELQAALTPAEYQEYLLRNAGTAAGLRTQLADFDGSENEFHDLALARLNSAGDDAARQVLSVDSYTACQRAQDKDYQQTLRITDRFDLPDETAVQIYEMQKAAQAQAKQIAADDSRTADQRQALRQAIQDETEKSISSVLDPTQFQAYKKYGGNWLEKLPAPAP